MLTGSRVSKEEEEEEEELLQSPLGASIIPRTPNHIFVIKYY
jgi:hypothetical protein